MKKTIFTKLLLPLAVLLMGTGDLFAWGTDVIVNPVQGTSYNWNRVVVAYDGTIYLGRVSATTGGYVNWEVLKSVDSGTTFTAFASGGLGGDDTYTAFEILAAGENAADFKLFVARAYRNSTTGNADMIFSYYNAGGSGTTIPLAATNFNYVARGYVSLALATDSKNANSGASPYSVSLVAAKASTFDSIVVWTDNDGGANFFRRSLYGSIGYIRQVSAAIGSASPNVSGYGRLGIIWDEFDQPTDPWGDIKVQYVYPYDGSDPGIYAGPHNASVSTGVYRNPSIALSQNTSANDIKTFYTYEYNNGGHSDISSRVDSAIINSAPQFQSSPSIGSGPGDQVQPYIKYNAVTDSFMIVYHDGATHSLTYKREKDVDIMNGGPLQTISNNFRDAAASMTDAGPRLDAVAGGHTYFTWRDGSATMFEAEYSDPASVQSASLNIAELKLFPNPASHRLNLSFSAADNDDILLHIVDMSGRMVLSSRQAVSKGVNSASISVSAMPAGNYMLQIKGARSNTAMMFTVTK
jgi:hypothetical protein